MNAEAETAILALSALAAAPWAIAAGMLLSGKWRISTASPPKPKDAPAPEPAVTGVFPSVPSVPANGAGSPAGAL